MDIISSWQMRQYEDILGEINSEFERSERLKTQIEEAENLITFFKLSLSSYQRKISYANVKIFGSVAEIENLYHELGDCHNVFGSSKCDGCNFFLIEVILTKSLLEKLESTRWKLQIVVRSEEFSVCKVVPPGDKSSVMEIVPVDNSVIDCIVDVHLFYCYENEWITLHLASINVDISFYFETYKEKQKGVTMDSFLKITKLHNSGRNLTCFRTLPLVQNQFKCDFDKHSFIPTFVRNSYHRLNLESFSEVANDSRRVIQLQFSANNKQIFVFYRKDTNILKVKCCPDLMQFVKTFFEKFLSSDRQEFSTRLKNIKNKKSDLEDMDLDEILSFHQQIRRLWL